MWVLQTPTNTPTDIATVSEHLFLVFLLTHTHQTHMLWCTQSQLGS